MIPDENKRDLKDIPDNIKGELEIIPVKWIDEVLEVALQRIPTPGANSSDASQEKKQDSRISAH